MASLLMTRPRVASERFITQLPRDLRDRVTPVISPVIDIVPTAGAIEFDDARGLIFTSANGVIVASDLTGRRDLPCYCVGAATTQAASAAGWHAECAGETADDLVQTLTSSLPDVPLLHLRGAHARGDVARRLSRSGCATHEQVVYDQRLMNLTETAQKLLAGTSPVIVPVFSPRSARQFANQYRGRAPLFIAALSGAVAGPLYSIDYKALEISARPDAQAMTETVRKLVNGAKSLEGAPGAQ